MQNTRNIFWIKILARIKDNHPKKNLKMNQYLQLKKEVHCKLLEEDHLKII